MSSAEQIVLGPTGENLRLAALGPADLDLILTIERRSHPYPWPRQHLVDSLQQHCSLGLWIGTDLAGYALYSTLSQDAELLLFVVDKTRQGQGLGRLLLERVVADVRERAEMLFLEVRPSNAAARALYETVGFNEVGRRRNYYPNGPQGPEDACIYAMDLAPAPW